MENILLITVFLVVGMLRVGNGMSISNGMLSDAEIKILAQYPCEEPAIFNPKIDVRPGDSFDVSAELQTQVDNTYKVLFKIDKLVGNKWQENFISNQGQLCDLMNKHTKKVWYKLRMATTPQITDSCIIPKGKYVIKKFSILSADLEIPTAFYGDWRVTEKIYNKDGELFFCQIVEAESQKNL